MKENKLNIKIPNLQIENIAIKLIKGYKNNAKKHPQEQIDIIKRSIEQFGFRNPILLNNLNEKIIVAGHGRLLAAKQLNMSELPCLSAEDLTDEQIKAFRIMDNRSQESEWDLVLLKEELTLLEESNFDLDLTGFGFDEISGIMNINSGDVEEDNFDTERALIKPKYNVNKGDVYTLGEHRLMCGDSTKEEDVKLLIGNKKIDSIVTDPPYGVDYANKNEFLNKMDEGNRIQEAYASDEIGRDYYLFLGDFLKEGQKYLNEYNTIYVFIGSTKMHELLTAFKQNNLKMHIILVWVKNNHVLSRCDYLSKHEFIIYGWKGKHKFYGKSPKTVFNYDKPLVNDKHPTMKPIPLVAELIQHGSIKGGNIYEPFGGSGTTLIACEKLGRNCFVMEKMPRYVSVIIERWEELTGKKAKKL